MNARIGKFLLLIVFTVQFSHAQDYKKLPKPITVEQVSFDWLGDGSKVTITLQLLTDFGLPVEAERIRTHIRGQKDFVHDTENGWGNIEDANVSKSVKTQFIKTAFKSKDLHFFR